MPKPKKPKKVLTEDEAADKQLHKLMKSLLDACIVNQIGAFLLSYIPGTQTSLCPQNPKQPSTNPAEDSGLTPSTSS